MTTFTDKLQTLRKRAGLSQEEIAGLLKMSRVTYNQVETGKRDLKKSELESLAHIFEMSMAELVTDQSPQIDQIAPSHPLYKMIQAVLYILNRTAGKPNVGKIVLNKLLYFADFNHYEKYRESISGDSYIKMPMGPVPKMIDAVLALMQQSKLIQAIDTNYYGHTQTRFIPNVSRDSTIFNASEIEDLDEVIASYGDKNGKQLTEFSHGDMPYKAVEHIGDEISYDLAHYREGIYSVASDDDRD